jgi:xanthine dehydrogenase YagR molybdenum-binding subunit
MKTIGKPIDRVDARLKVTGRATYAAEHWEAGRPLYGFIAGATVGKGRIARIDPTRAAMAPGVRHVFTYLDAAKQGTPDPKIASMYDRALPTLASPEIRHYGEPVALVVAHTYEQARAAATLIEVEYAPEEGQFDFAARLEDAYAPRVVNAGLATDSTVGDVDGAMASAEVVVDRTYTTPYQFAQPMEPHACLAVPRAGDLTLYVSAQVVASARTCVAGTLLIDEARIRVVSTFVGGGFGSKLGIHAETILAAMAARELGQPVKVVLTRQQIAHLVGSRPTTSQHVRLAAGRDGRLVALSHHVTMYTSPRWEYAEQTATAARVLYSAPHRSTRHRLVRLDLPRGEDVRAPGEAPGLLALESAMDELAHALDMDPIELRMLNEPSAHPEGRIPFSERRLVECMREGARRFGWARRSTRPASVRDGRWLVGYGMAAAVRQHFQGATKARVRMGPDGIAVVQSDTTDIGTGTYTVVAQVAAETLDLPLERVRVELGCSDHPVGAGSGGSWAAGNTCTAVHRACVALREKLRHRPKGKQLLEAEGEVPGEDDEPSYASHAIHTYGAHFVEVGVDVDTAEIRLRRMLGVFSAGRILNAKTARSQLIGGMTFGVSAALLESATLDTRTGAFVDRDLASYLVPVHADIPEIDAVLLDGFDEKANVLGAKGIGELGNCGANAAVANAVFNATGVRVRDFPITIEKLLPGLPFADA